MDKRHHLGLDSYDRFFPNQDTLPNGGFGNLIAFPLQWKPRENGNSLFADDNFRSYPDQWKILAPIGRTAFDLVGRIVIDAARQGSIVGVRISASDEDFEAEPWKTPPSKKKAENLIQGPLPAHVE